ncbi:MAG: 30S ribosomal protein S16 [Verrucomicrobiota bacterium]|nr:30S ribosomal protein S16 [Verrucomicrobiota bacterium]
MAVRIRLRRMGKTNSPSYRVMVADKRSPRDGKFIEQIGYYRPIQKELDIKLDRAEYWLSQGASPSETVERLIKMARAGEWKVQPKEEPQPEEPKVEENKAEEPQPEEPKVEEPQPEEPKVEEPKVEEPKVEEPKAEKE